MVGRGKMALLVGRGHQNKLDLGDSMGNMTPDWDLVDGDIGIRSLYGRGIRLGAREYGA